MSLVKVIIYQCKLHILMEKVQENIFTKLFIFKMEYGIFQHQKYFVGQLHHGQNQKIET